MKKFKFKFDKILTFRRHQEKEKQRDLAKIMGIRKKQEDDIGDIRISRVDWQNKEKKELLGTIQPQRLGGYSRYFLKLTKLEMAGIEALKVIDREADKKRELLIEAARNRKMYEKLKERHHKKFNRDLDLLEQKENDETGTKLFVQNR